MSAHFAWLALYELPESLPPIIKTVEISSNYYSHERQHYLFLYYDDDDDDKIRIYIYFFAGLKKKKKRFYNILYAIHPNVSTRRVNPSILY